MVITKHIRQDIQLYFGSRGAIKKHRTGYFKDLTNPDHLGLFFSIRTKEELYEIRKLLSVISKTSKKITANIFYNSHESIDVITNKSIFMFNLNDFNIFGKKKEELQQKFDENRFDLMISFTFDADSFCRKLISELNADFKIGPEQPGGSELYDLMILKPTEKMNFMDFYADVSHYLKVLNLNSG